MGILNGTEECRIRKQAQDRAEVADGKAGAVLQYYKTTVKNTPTL